MMTPETIIRRPIILTEKSNTLREPEPGRVRGRSGARTRSRSRRRPEALQRQGRERQHHGLSRQGSPHGSRLRQAAELEEGDRHPRRGREHRVLRRDARRAEMGIKTYKPTAPARRYYSVSDFKEITTGKKPEKKLLEHQTSHRRPQHPRPHHQPLPWRWTQAALPRHRLPPRQDRRARRRSRRSSTIRTARRASRSSTTPTARRRYILAPDGLDGRRQGRREPQRGHQAGQLDAAPAHPARHDDPQHRDAEGQGRSARSLRRHPARRSWRRTATTRRSACPPARSA